MAESGVPPPRPLAGSPPGAFSNYVSPEDAGAPDADTLRFMVFTDNHLGFKERDPIRRHDSFFAFEECLYNAHLYECDAALNGGDIYHENKPTRTTMYRSMEVLRKYVLGARPVTVELMSDPTEHFGRGGSFNRPNFEDPNYNVGLPVFGIHGNHDDRTRDSGEAALSAMDLLSVSNLVNFFGSQDQSSSVDVRPVLLRKGKTKVALYGFGSMRDDRLHALLRKGRVRFHCPPDVDEWFHVMLIHQNRGSRGRGPRSGFDEAALPSFLDLVIWGHEHDCQIVPIARQGSAAGAVRISQPGSTVPTQLTEGESIPKQCAILDIKSTSTKEHMFRLIPVPLRTARPLYVRDIELAHELPEVSSDPDEATDEARKLVRDTVTNILQAHAQDSERVETLEAAEMAEIEDETKLPFVLTLPLELRRRLRLPLVRVRVEHTGFAPFLTAALGADFAGRVANPDGLVLLHKKRVTKPTTSSRAAAAAAEVFEMGPVDTEDALATSLDEGALRRRLVNGYVCEHLANPSLKPLSVLQAKELLDATDRFVGDDSRALEEQVNKAIQRARKRIRELNTESGEMSEGAIKEAAERLAELERSKLQKDMVEQRQEAAAARKEREKAQQDQDQNEDEEQKGQEDPPQDDKAPKKKKKDQSKLGEKRPRSKPAPPKRSTRSKRRRKDDFESDEEELEQEEEEEEEEEELEQEEILISDSEEDEKKKKKRPSRKAKPPSKSAAQAAPLSPVSSRRKKRASVFDDSEEEEEEEAPRRSGRQTSSRRRGGSSRRPKKPETSIEEEDESFSEEEEDEEEDEGGESSDGAYSRRSRSRAPSRSVASHRVISTQNSSSRRSRRRR